MSCRGVVRVRSPRRFPRVCNAPPVEIIECNGTDIVADSIFVDILRRGAVSSRVWFEATGSLAFGKWSAFERWKLK